MSTCTHGSSPSPSPSPASFHQLLHQTRQRLLPAAVLDANRRRWTVFVSDVALEEICRSEGDDPDDAHSDPVS